MCLLLPDVTMSGELREARLHMMKDEEVWEQRKGILVSSPLRRVIRRRMSMRPLSLPMSLLLLFQDQRRRMSRRVLPATRHLSMTEQKTRSEFCVWWRSHPVQMDGTPPSWPLRSHRELLLLWGSLRVSWVHTTVQPMYPQ